MSIVKNTLMYNVAGSNIGAAVGASAGPIGLIAGGATGGTLGAILGRFKKDKPSAECYAATMVLMVSSNICCQKNNELVEGFNEIEDYFVEIENFEEDLEYMIKTVNSEKEEKQNRIDILNEKAEKGTITKEEQDELTLLLDQINVVNPQVKQMENALNAKLNSDVVKTFENKCAEGVTQAANTINYGISFSLYIGGLNIDKSPFKSYVSQANANAVALATTAQTLVNNTKVLANNDVQNSENA